MDLKRIIDVAMGREKADLVLKGASVLNVFTEQLEHKDVAICDGMIAGLGRYDGTKEVDVTGKIIVPGFMDAHMHLESTLLTPAEFERGSLPHGTVAVMADPHEIANVAGTEGIDYIMQLCEDLDMHIWFNLPSCVPAAPLEESGETLEADDLRPYYEKSNVLGLAEVMNSVGVTEGDPALLQKIADAKANNRIIDGHAPFLGGKDLCAYTAAGVRSDHECTDKQEAIDKLARGQWIMIREGTAAKNLNALLPLCSPPYCYRSMFCTDDRHPEDLLREGHMDAIIRKAVAQGVSAVHAIQMCTLNTAQYFGLKERGAIAPGYHADIIVLGDFIDFAVEQVYIDGRLVAKDGKVLKNHSAPLPDNKKILHSFHMQPVTSEQLCFGEIKERQRVIGLKRRELLTDEIIIQPTERGRLNNGVDIERDILKAAVFERHHNTGHVGVGFITGYGIKKGAVATSVAHDSHNLIVVGCSDQDIAAAAEAVRAMDGGLVVVEDGKVIEALPLPIAGLMSPLAIEEVDARMKKLKEAAKRLGVSDDIDPFMTLAFVSLPVIPVLRLNGKGLINVNRQEIVEATF
ncbi:MAG: adenine deaminase [Ruminococcus sp.]|nr:adenine deaminase [Ruminococcus sp.]